MTAPPSSWPRTNSQSVTSSDRLLALSDGEVIFDGDPSTADPHALADGWFDRAEPADDEIDS